MFYYTSYLHTQWETNQLVLLINVIKSSILYKSAESCINWEKETAGCMVGVCTVTDSHVNFYKVCRFSIVDPITSGGIKFTVLNLFAFLNAQNKKEQCLLLVHCLMRVGLILSLKGDLIQKWGSRL